MKLPTLLFVLTPLLANAPVHAADCNGNGIDDAVDIASGTSADCNGNGVPDECDLDGIAALFLDFDSSPPPGVSITTNGLWHVGSACRPAGDCGADDFAYFGVDATCDYFTGSPEQGSLEVLSIPLPEKPALSLKFCSYYEGEGGGAFDEVDIAVVFVREAGGSGLGDLLEFTSTTSSQATWETRTLDLTKYAGTTVDLEFLFFTDDKLFNDFFGWGVDDLRITFPGDLNDNGVLDDCECLVSNYCIAAPNSVGPGAIIGQTGTVMISRNDFVLATSGLPASDFGVYYYGPNATEIPFGDGFRCIAPPFHRLPVVQSTGAGVATFAFDYESPVHNPGKHVFAGATHDFQYWCRDHVPGGTNFNLSDGLAILFCP